MKSDSVFRRNLLIVAALHIAFVVALFVVSKLRPQPATENIMWLDGGSLGGEAMESNPAPEQAAPEPEPPPPVPPEPEPEPEPETKPALIKPPSEIPLATPEPATPKPITPKPATPKPATPKPATPKPATPKPATAKPSVSPKPSASATVAKAKGTPAASPKASPALAKASGAPASGTPGAKSTGSGTGVGSGKGAGREGGGARASEHGWYLQMIDERFRTRWVQPTDIERGGADVSTLLKVRINADGTIALREITKESGYAQMDESVLRAAENVRQLDPLPAGLGTNGVFEVNIQFKLDQGQ